MIRLGSVQLNLALCQHVGSNIFPQHGKRVLWDGRSLKKSKIIQKIMVKLRKKGKKKEKKRKEEAYIYL